MAAINYARRYWRQLQRRGYRLVEIVPGGKSSQRKGWQVRELTAEDINRPAYDGAWGVGIVTGPKSENIIGLDFDIPDEKLADEIYAEACRIAPQIAPLPKRIGKAPKFLLVARTAEPLKKMTSCMWTNSPAGTPSKDCVKFRFEILADGQQFVAFAEHPGTGHPYAWVPQDLFDPRTSPLDTDAAAWPLITVEELDRLRAMTDEKCKAFGLRILESERDTKPQETDPQVLALMPALPPLGLSVDEVRELFREAGYTMVSRAEWLEALMAVKHEFQNREDEGLALAIELSQWAEEIAPGTYKGPEDVTRTWNSLKRNSAGCVTMRTVQLRARRSGSLAARAEAPSADGLTAYFIVKFGDRIAYQADTKRFVSFNGVRYVPDDEGPLLGDEFTGEAPRTNIVAFARAEWIRHVESHLPPPPQDEKEAKTYAKDPWVRLLASLTNRPGWVPNTIKDYLENNLLIRKLSTDFDCIPFRLPVANGSVDLKTGEFCPPRPEELLSKSAPVAYVKDADCPLWKASVREWMSGDEADMRYLQKLVGYALLGQPDQQVVHFLVGEGSNGKSLFTDILQKLFGPYYRQIDKAALLGFSRTNGAAAGGARPELARLKGSRFVVCSETEEGDVLKAGELKALTGDATLTVRGLYSDYVTFDTTWNIFIVTNYMPQTVDLSEGMFRRLRIVEFRERYSKDPERVAKGLAKQADTGLYSKLRTELPGILNWALEGVRLYLKEGLTATPRVQRAVNRYRSDMDFLRAWYEECTVACDEATEENAPLRDAKVLYDSWLSYVRRNNCPNAYYTQRRFSLQLSKSLGIRVQKRRHLCAVDRMLKVGE